MIALLKLTPRTRRRIRLVRARNAERFFPYNNGMENKRMGRPPKAPEEPQTARLEIGMTEAELKLIESAADGSTSTWCA
jgi:hypothetical protein